MGTTYLPAPDGRGRTPPRPRDWTSRWRPWLERARALRAEGLSYGAIGAALGVSPWTVGRVLGKLAKGPQGARDTNKEGNEAMTTTNEAKGTNEQAAKGRGRGFDTLTPERRREIASQGGKAAHALGKAHRFTPDEAKKAGRKGGKAAHAKGTAHAFTPDEAREAGRKGGASAHANGTAHAFTPEAARAAGKKGGEASQARAKAAKGGAP